MLVHPGEAFAQPGLQVVDFIVKVLGDVVVVPYPHAPSGPCLAVALLGSLHGQDVGQRVHRGHDALVAQVSLTVLRPALLEGGGVGRVAVQPVPPEGHQVNVFLLVQHVVVLIDPGVGAPALPDLAVPEGQVHVPQHHLEARIHTVAALVEFAAQAVAVHVVAQLGNQLIGDERLHVDVAAVARVGVEISWRCQHAFHLVDAVVDVFHLFGLQIVIAGKLVLDEDAVARQRLAVGCDGVIA